MTARFRRWWTSLSLNSEGDASNGDGLLSFGILLATLAGGLLLTSGLPNPGIQLLIVIPVSVLLAIVLQTLAAHELAVHPQSRLSRLLGVRVPRGSHGALLVLIAAATVIPFAVLRTIGLSLPGAAIAALVCGLVAAIVGSAQICIRSR